MRKMLIALAVFALGWIGQPRIVHAQSVNQFTVKAVLPADNAKGVSHFDLNVVPQHSRTLTVAITNQAKQPQRFAISAANAVTNSGGIIAYDAGTRKTAPTHVAFSDLLQARTKALVTVPARQTKTVGFVVKAPTQRFSGLVLGAFNVESLTAAAQAKRQGGMVNLANYVLGVSLHESSAAVKPRLRLTGAGYTSANALPIVAIKLANRAPTIIGAVRLQARVTNAHGQSVARVDRRQLNFAPDNAFTYALGTTGQKALRAGKYHLDLKIAADNGHWHFKKAFTVSAKRVAKTKIVHHIDYAWWLWRLVDLVAVGIIIWFIVSRIRQRRR